MFTSILAAVAAITRFMPTLERFGDVLYAAWKDAQAKAVQQHTDNVNARADEDTSDLAAERQRIADLKTKGPAP